MGLLGKCYDDDDDEEEDEEENKQRHAPRMDISASGNEPLLPLLPLSLPLLFIFPTQLCLGGVRRRSAATACAANATVAPVSRCSCSHIVRTCAAECHARCCTLLVFVISRDIGGGYAS